MPRIHVLPPLVVNQIAAGEVIERPASVVKELLENAIDAGANHLTIDVENGGADLIRVVDNGHGIDPADLPLVFASHATSKLRHADDLAAITTLGFRGEAMASIGSVAEVTLQSRPSGADTGAMIVCRGGDLSAVQPWNGQPGTRVEVRHLFFNTPARRKFLRSAATEIGHISEMGTRLALGFPNLAVTLRHNDKTIYTVNASAGLAERIRLFFGKDIADHLLAIDQQSSAIRLSGFVADPSVDRGNARFQYLFLNGRAIRDRTLMHAVQEAYHGLLMTGRYAVAFLFIELPPNEVDVNVHPTKAEVRFRDSQALHHFLRSVIRDRLTRASKTPMLRPTAAERGGDIRLPSGNGVSAAAWQLRAPPSVPSLWTSAPPRPTPIDDPAIRPAALPTPTVVAAPPPAAPPPVVTPSAPELANPPGASPPPAPTAKAIQLHNAYLVLETEGGMIVIDQHALHERILYEAWKAKVREGPLETQRLLIPEPVDLAAEQAALVLAHSAALRRLGIEVQDFGHGTVLVMSVPTLVRRLAPGALLRRAAEYLATAEKSPPPEILLDHLLATLACHAAVKAGDPLTDSEIDALLAHREWVADSHHCPHGRPTSLFFSKQDLDRQFKRL